jgi:heme exporter protein B
VGTTFSAMAVNTRAKELTLPILFFPIVVPVIIAASEATGAILSNNITFEFARWLFLLVAFDLIFLVLSAMTFKFIINE